MFTVDGIMPLFPMHPTTMTGVNAEVSQGGMAPCGAGPLRATVLRVVRKQVRVLAPI